jgi:hypothetical protein
MTPLTPPGTSTTPAPSTTRSTCSSPSRSPSICASTADPSKNRPSRGTSATPSSKSRAYYRHPGDLRNNVRQRASSTSHPRKRVGLVHDWELTLHSVSKLFDKTNTFACTRFIEEGTLALREKAEYRTDKDLYHVIRLQRIIENVDKIANASDSEEDAHAAYLRVRTELEEFRIYLCSDVSDSRKSAPTTHRSPTKHVQNFSSCSSTPQSSFCTTLPSLSGICSMRPVCT